jgi:hypothetical protein
MQVANLLLKRIVRKAWRQQYWAGYKVSIIKSFISFLEIVLMLARLKVTL